MGECSGDGDFCDDRVNEGDVIINRLAGKIVEDFLINVISPDKSLTKVMEHFSKTDEDYIPFYIPAQVEKEYHAAGFRDEGYFCAELRKDITHRVVKGINRGTINIKALKKFAEEYPLIWSPDGYTTQEYAFMLASIKKVKQIKSVPSLANALYGKTYCINYCNVSLPPKADKFVSSYPEEAVIIGRQVIFDAFNCISWGRVGMKQIQELYNSYPELYQKSLNAVLKNIAGRKPSKSLFMGVKNFTKENAKIGAPAAYYSVFPDVLKICKAYAENYGGLKACIYLKSLDKIAVR